MARVLIGNFKGPKGDKGDQGLTGPQGPQGIQGPVGPAGGVSSVNGGTGDVVIGGVNLVRNSTGNLGDISFWGSNTKVSVDGYAGHNCIVCERSGYSGSDADVFISDNIKPHLSNTRGEKITASGYFYIDSSVQLDSDDGSIVIRYDDDGSRDITVARYDTKTERDKWIYFKGSGTVINEDFERVSLMVRIKKNGKIRLSCLKIEFGTVPTDWTPSPEDKADVNKVVSSLNGQRGDVTVGGRNLLSNTGTFEGWKQYVPSHPATISDGVVTCSASGLTANTYIGLTNDYKKLLYREHEGKELTISFDIRSEDWSKVDDANGKTGLSAVAIQMGVVSQAGDRGAYRIMYLGEGKVYPIAAVNGRWLHIVCKPFRLDSTAWDYNGELTEGYPYLIFQFMLRRNGTVSWRNFKLECGSVATDWTPASEDKQDRLTGSAGQVVGFDDKGNAVAQDVPEVAVRTITLTPSGWSGNTQSAACQGIVEDETKQAVDICPKVSDFKAYCDAGAYVSGFAKDRLTFTCQSAPAGNITVYVKIQNV